MNVTSHQNPTHFNQLDALRGIAALTVVFNHFAIIDPMRWIWHTPLRFLFTSHNAVILFFMISGFVLTLQLTAKKPSFRIYMTKRVCRIYLPYLAVLIAAYALEGILFDGPVGWAGVWANRAWDGSFSMLDVLGHVMFLGKYRADQVVPVIWTLVYEMRISLIFPFVVYAVSRMRARSALGLAFVLSVAAYASLYVAGAQTTNANLRVDWALTAHYTGIFVFGAVLALHREKWMAWLASAPRRVSVLLASLAFYLLSRGILGLVPDGIGDVMFDWGAALGAGGIICTAVTSRRFTAVLALRPIAFIGALSYSLYLSHSVVLLSVIHLMPAADTATLALVVAGALVVPVAIAIHYLIELPSIALGRFLTARANPLPERARQF